MLNRIKESRASRVVVAAAIVAMGAVAVTSSPSFAQNDDGRDPNGLYIFGLNPWDILVLPFKVVSRLIIIPVGIIRVPDDYDN